MGIADLSDTYADFDDYQRQRGDGGWPVDYGYMLDLEEQRWRLQYMPEHNALIAVEVGRRRPDGRVRHIARVVNPDSIEAILHALSAQQELQGAGGTLRKDTFILRDIFSELAGTPQREQLLLQRWQAAQLLMRELHIQSERREYTVVEVGSIPQTPEEELHRGLERLNGVDWRAAAAVAVRALQEGIDPLDRTALERHARDMGLEQKERAALLSLYRDPIRLDSRASHAIGNGRHRSEYLRSLGVELVVVCDQQRALDPRPLLECQANVLPSHLRKAPRPRLDPIQSAGSTLQPSAGTSDIAPTPAPARRIS